MYEVLDPRVPRAEVKALDQLISNSNQKAFLVTASRVLALQYAITDFPVLIKEAGKNYYYNLKPLLNI